nr:MAG TPA: hypothetical protein [Caudoviricetes sp.]
MLLYCVLLEELQIFRTFDTSKKYFTKAKQNYFTTLTHYVIILLRCKTKIL